MSDAWMLLRLLTRRQRLPILAFAALGVSGIPVRVLVESMLPTGAAAARGWGSQEMALLVFAAFLPGAVGFLILYTRATLESSAFAWSLPGLQRGLTAGTLLLALPAVGLPAALAVLVAPAELVPAVIGTAALAYAVTAMFSGAPVPIAIAAYLAIPVIVFRPAVLPALVAPAPVAVGILALATALLIARRHVEASRTRGLRARRHGDNAGALSWWLVAFLSGPKWLFGYLFRRGWHGDLTTDRLGPWLRARSYEDTAGFFGVPVTAIAIIGAVLAQVFGDPLVLLLTAAFFLESRNAPRGAVPLDPLARRQRARLAWAGYLLDAGLIALFMAGLLIALDALGGLPRLRLFAEESTVPRNWPAAVGLVFALAPIMQWSPIRWGAGVLDWRPQAIVAFTLYAVIGSVVAVLLPPAQEPLRLAGWILGIAAVVQVAFWFAVRWHYTTADLVRPAPGTT